MVFRNILLVVLLTCSALPVGVAAEAIVANEHELHAAFLYNFALYTEWPALPANEFSICVLGNDAVFAALAAVKTKRIKERAVSVINIAAIDKATSCQILYISKSLHTNIDELIRAIGNAPILLVAEEPDYNFKKVDIALATKQDRVTFKINRSYATRKSILFSSKLLKLATEVY